MQWLEHMAALAGVLLLFMLCAHAARAVLMKSGRGMLLKGKQARLALQDSLMLDSKHRVVLFSVDGDEYMALLGGEIPHVAVRKTKKKQKQKPTSSKSILEEEPADA